MLFAVICATNKTELFNERYKSYQAAIRAAMIVAQTFSAKNPTTAVVYTDTGEVVEMF